MSKNFSDAYLASPKRKEGEIVRDGVNGLIVRCGAKGVHTFRVCYRDANGASRKEKLGKYPQMSVAEARAAAQEFADRRKRGVPTTKAQAKPNAGMTIANLLYKYEQARRHDGLKTFAKSMRVLRRGLAPYLALEVDAFRKSDMLDAFDRMREPAEPGGKPRLVAANRFAAYASKLWTWSMNRDLVPQNFSKACERTKEKPRSRVLTMDELAAVWQATLTLEHTGTGRGRIARRNYGRMVRFLMLTGQRLGNGTDLRHRDIVKGVWTQNENKRDTPLVLTLPEAALAEVGTGDLGARVFASERGGLLNNLSALNDEVIALSGVADWSHHTLRHTIVSQLARAKVPFEVREALLHHKLKGMGAIAAVYTHYEFEEEMRDALALWAKMVTGHAGPPLRAVA